MAFKLIKALLNMLFSSIVAPICYADAKATLIRVDESPIYDNRYTFRTSKSMKNISKSAFSYNSNLNIIGLIFRLEQQIEERSKPPDKQIDGFDKS
jgi:hypothetical protein